MTNLLHFGGSGWALYSCSHHFPDKSNLRSEVSFHSVLHFLVRSWKHSRAIMWTLLSSVFSVHHLEVWSCVSGAWVQSVYAGGSTFTESRKELLSGSSEAMDSMNAPFRSVYFGSQQVFVLKLKNKIGNKM